MELSVVQKPCSIGTCFHFFNGQVHLKMNTAVIGYDMFAGSVALDGMKVDTIFYWSFFASPFAWPLVEKSAWSGNTSDSENARQWHFIRAERSSNGSE